MKKWVGNRKKIFYGEMWRNADWEGEACEKFVWLSMFDGHVGEYLVHAR